MHKFLTYFYFSKPNITMTGNQSATRIKISVMYKNQLVIYAVYYCDSPS